MTARGVPPWFRQTALLLLIWVAVMWALAHWLSVWHDWDWRFFDWLKPAPSTLSSQIALVDMDYTDPSEIPQHRKLLAVFIGAAAKQHPAGIILDIPFGQCTPMPCSSEMAAARRLLVQAIDGAKRANIPVYANVGSVALTPGGLPDGSAPQLDPQIYAELSGYGHTAVVVQSETVRSGDLFYFVCYANYPAIFRAGIPQDVWDLVDVALYPDEFIRTPAMRRICDPNQRIAVRYGPPVPDQAPAEYHISGPSPFPRGANLSGRYVIVGVPAFDTHSETGTRPGPEVFAWTVNDELAYRQLDQSAVQTQGSALPFLVAAFSAISVLAFVAWFFFLRRLPLGPARLFLPWISALLSFGVGVVAFMAFEFWMLRGPMHQIQPQVSLISLGMALASLLSGVRGAQVEFDARNKIDAIETPEQYDYDVFISYAHEELDWVMEHVYVPFQNARLPDGKKLKLFFDTSAIRIGTAWQDKISLSIDGSKFVVPVYSETYFQRPYCRFEIKRAQRKWIGAGEQSRCVLPIMRGHPTILQTVDDIQAVSIDDQADIVDLIIAEIVGRLSPKAPPADEG